jgi:2-polyprenyl-6-methoxyphenol hydroxylase-like FAD-dependent oxidoreductase
MNMRARVIGGGIAGAATALALSKVGIEVELYEAGTRAPVESAPVLKSAARLAT